MFLIRCSEDSGMKKTALLSKHDKLNRTAGSYCNYAL